MQSRIDQCSRDYPDYTLTCMDSQDLSQKQVGNLVALVRSNLRDLYEASSWGWSESRKREEMMARHQKFLMIQTRATPASLAGFLSFEVVDEDGPCIYCYEVQLTPSLRGSGVGRTLMSMMEAIGRNHGMIKAMLTVFMTNAAARTFYEKLGYTKDESSPEPIVTGTTRSGSQRIEMPDYLILSKSL